MSNTSISVSSCDVLCCNVPNVALGTPFVNNFKAQVKRDFSKKKWNIVQALGFGKHNSSSVHGNAGTLAKPLASKKHN
jgi:hypothetical protein